MATKNIEATPQIRMSFSIMNSFSLRIFTNHHKLHTN
jgi:hypothetical protein